MIHCKKKKKKKKIEEQGGKGIEAWDLGKEGWDINKQINKIPNTTPLPSLNCDSHDVMWVFVYMSTAFTSQ